MHPRERFKNTINKHDGNSASYGLCQIKKETAQGLGFKGTPRDLMKPEVNAWFAAKYLRYQIRRYGGDKCKATAAYNAGTYNESEVYPGLPKNYRYIKYVNVHLKDEYAINCGE